VEDTAAVGIVVVDTGAAGMRLVMAADMRTLKLPIPTWDTSR
jgi:hypothetical protein